MENEEKLPRSVKFLILSNRLLVKAFESDTSKKLHFIILNETKHILSYDSAFLWDLIGTHPKISGISGMVGIDENTELIKSWEKIVSHIPNKNTLCQLDGSMFQDCKEEWQSIKKNANARYFWLPIYSQSLLHMGLVVSFNDQNYEDIKVSEEIDIFMNFLMPGYAAALNKFSKKKVMIGGKRNRMVTLGILSFLLLIGNFYEVPLRIVSSCKVVSRDPVIIAAPLDGVIEEVKVVPGQTVEKGELLVEYEKSSFIQDLQLARKEVEVREAEVGRVTTLGYEDEEKLSELKVLLAKNDQAHAKLNFAKYQFDLITIESPSEGVVSIDNPEEWKGRPVTIGEKILTINNQNDTKILIWIAEGDNINLEKDRSIKVILNASPNTSYQANLEYISSISKVNDENIVSFEAEAGWLNQPENIKIGQKGVVIMYGENVSLLYYLFRKPILFFRRTFGY